MVNRITKLHRLTVGLVACVVGSLLVMSVTSSWHRQLYYWEALMSTTQTHVVNNNNNSAETGLKTQLHAIMKEEYSSSGVVHSAWLSSSIRERLLANFHWQGEILML
jgi:hypothetical protein